ncbi:DUF3606 domain-containing protein [Pedobacter steynii]|uniref:DUF3606 domain-containing protein n=1 Tax=Pedobacter steynii TaxID=430522 RepID=A0A1D7QMX3_9SPHI|nr:DUF3606 domain-containing protein [Pedobacter steynii]AOM80014.1 DUF3606 domain-containing protein [Pedobacter steynii]
MPDNKDKTGGQDRNKVAADQEYEVSYLATKLGVSKAEVLEAIKAVGNDRQKIEAYLKK